MFDECEPVPLAERVRLTERPVGQRVVMRQQWRDLLFLHWPVEPAVIQRLLPPGLTVDTFEGKAYVGLVPFAMRNVRPVWAPSVPWLSHFLEANVRTYVHCEGREPGVWFFSLDAANPIAVALARRFFHLPYFVARMSLQRSDSGQISYRSVRHNAVIPADCRMVYEGVGEPAPAVPGTLFYFLAERYLLYSFDGKNLRTGRVWHTPYPLQEAIYSGLGNSLVSAAGISLGTAEPPLAHFAAGVDVLIFPLQHAKTRNIRVK